MEPLLIRYPIFTALQTAVLAKCIFQFHSHQNLVGNFTSPKYPENYSDDLECIYNFLGRDYETLRLTFHDFELEAPFKKGCLTDYIDVSTITITHNKFLVGRFCGTTIPPSMLFMNPHAEIIFKTNHVVRHKGFHAKYEFQDEEVIPPPPSTSNVSDCGGTLTGVGGVLLSPGFPQYFPKDVDCIWLIRVDYNMKIFLRVLQFQLYGSIANCGDAELAIYDGYSSISFNPHLLQKYCGDLRYYKNVDERTTLSGRNRLLIRFRSSVSQTWKGEESGAVGFKLAWTAVTFKDDGECTDFVCTNSRYCMNAMDRSCAITQNYCIDQSLVCNGLPNCSSEDTSDEDKCNLTLLSGCGVAGGVILLTIIIAILLYRRHGQGKKNLSHSQSLNMQLRQLEHSPTYTGRVPDGNFYFQPPTNCSIHSGSHYDVIHTNSLQRPDKRAAR